jgi:hypothetical protein
MYPIYGPGQPDMQVSLEQLQGGPDGYELAWQKYPRLMYGMNQDFIERASPYYQEDMNPYGMGIPPAAPMMLGVAGPPPPPMLMGGAGGAALGETPKGQPDGDSGFGWRDAFNIALPFAAGAAGYMAGAAPQGNPQQVLQGLSLAHRSMMMPRPEQMAAMQRQKFIQELIASGNATPEGLATLKQQYPQFAAEIDAVMPHAQDQASMRGAMRSMMGLGGQPGAPGTAMPAPPAGSGQSGTQSLGLPPLPAVGGQSNYDMLPSINMGADGKMSMTMSPHQRPQPHMTETDNQLQAIQRLNAEIQRQLQSPNPDHALIQQMQTARQALAFGLRGKPQSPAGQAAVDRRFMTPDADQTEAQSLNAQMVNQGRMTMQTPQGQAHEDIRMEQQGLGRTNEDPQVAALQGYSQTIDTAEGNKDVAEALGGANAQEAVTRQFGPESAQAQAVSGALKAKNASKPSDVMSLGSQFQKASGDFGVTRDFYRQVEQVLRSGNPNAMADISFITAMAKILDPGSVVRPSESGMVQVESRAIPDTVKLWLQNWINQPQLLTPEQRVDLVNTVRQAYYSRLQTHFATREGFERQGQSLFPDRPASDITGSVPLDPIDLAYLRGRPATMADINAARERATKIGQPALAPMLLLQQGINPFADITQ